MTTDQYNALPEEARRFIQQHAGCLGCGNKEKKLTVAYERYLNDKKMAAYQLRGGGVNYNYNNARGVLYNVRVDDTPEEIRDKMKLAKALYAKAPHLFLSYNESEVEKTLKASPKEEVINLDKKKKPAAKKVDETPVEETEIAEDKEAEANTEDNDL